MKKASTTKLKKVTKKTKVAKKTTAKIKPVKPNKKNSVKKSSPSINKNGLHKDIVVLEEKIYTPPTRLLFWFTILISVILFEVLLKKIPFLYQYWEFLTAEENLKLYVLIIIITFLISLKLYINHKLKNEIRLKL